MNSLEEYLKGEKQKSLSSLEEIAKSIKSSLEKHCFKDLLFLVVEFNEACPDMAAAPAEISFFVNSNLFFMGEDICIDTVTYGADPEFIMCDAKDENKIVMYSSKYSKSIPYSSKGAYALSSLSIGADYGLLELRPEHSTTHEGLFINLEDLIDKIEELEELDGVDIKIKESEAVRFMHKIQRMREVMEEGKEIDYGVSRPSKAGGATTLSIDDIALAGDEYYGTSLTAFDTPHFVASTDKVLTAGGHLHFGGACIKILSMSQLRALIRKLDERLLPIAKKVETEAADLRREYYGLPGEFRLKPYGFEYRVLSCAPFWKKNLEVLKEILVEADRIITNFDYQE